MQHAQFSKWYPEIFNDALTFKSICFTLPDNVVQNIQADGVCTDLDFPETLAKEIQDGIAALGGKVFIKLNWSAPRDATWMLGSLQCTNLEDIALLLQSSDLLHHDLHSEYPLTLVLREWQSLHLSMEFRCFIKNHQLIAISQRNCQCYYPFLDEMRPELYVAISTFFTKHMLKDHQVSKYPLSDYVVDLYVDEKKKVTLVDINVYGETYTDTLLYTWDDMDQQSIITDVYVDNILDARELLCEYPDLFRVLESEAEQQRLFPKVSYSSYRVPVDFQSMALHTPQGMSEFLQQVDIDNPKIK